MCHDFFLLDPINAVSKQIDFELFTLCSMHFDAFKRYIICLSTEIPFYSRWTFIILSWAHVRPCSASHCFFELTKVVMLHVRDVLRYVTMKSIQLPWMQIKYTNHKQFVFGTDIFVVVKIDKHIILKKKINLLKGHLKFLMLLSDLEHDI